MGTPPPTPEPSLLVSTNVSPAAPMPPVPSTPPLPVVSVAGAP
jgi:hypothetical protein